MVVTATVGDVVTSSALEIEEAAEVVMEVKVVAAECGWHLLALTALIERIVQVTAVRRRAAIMVATVERMKTIDTWKRGCLKLRKRKSEHYQLFLFVLSGGKLLFLELSGLGDLN